MSQAIVGRIFWKEARVQRAFWAWILALGLFLQAAPYFLGHAYWHTAVDFHWLYSINTVIACCFAVGSTAIAFAGETEGRTKSLFQRLPLRVVDLLVGKLGWSLLGTYALALILSLTGSLWVDARANSLALVGSGEWQHDLNYQASDFWFSLLTPLPFLVVGILCSLALREVLTTVMVAGVVTAIFMAVVGGSENWPVGAPLLVLVAVADGFLLRPWLRDSMPAVSRFGLPRWGSSGTGLGHSTLGVRSSVAWRRAASSLFWKEWRQAMPFTLVVAGIGALAIFVLALWEWLEFRWHGSGTMNLHLLSDSRRFLEIGLMAVPLLFGIGAGRADRRDGAYRLLARCGISANAHWWTKHVVWVALALTVTAWFLTCDGVAPALPPRGMMRLQLGEMFQELASVTSIPDRDAWHLAGAQPAGIAATLTVIVFVVVLLYSLGHLFSLTIPSAMTALVLGLIGGACVAFVWAFILNFGFPFWWTLGLLPLIFFFASWLRSRDWLVERNSLRAWGRFGASIVVPIFAICCGVAVSRVVEIPAVTLPIELRESEARQSAQPEPFRVVTRAVVPDSESYSKLSAAPNRERSLFVSAVLSLSPRARRPAPLLDSDKHTVADGWEFADRETREWVEANDRVRQEALEAVKRVPGDFPELTFGGGPHTFSRDNVDNLVSLLLDSARKLEWEGKLDEALENYVAVARLGDDLQRANRSDMVWWMSLKYEALSAMDRWAAHPKQTAELIKRAIGIFQRSAEDAPFVSSGILRDWRIERAMFENYVWKGNNPDEQNRSAAETGLIRWFLPWEALRLQRVQDLMFSTALDAMQLVERDLRDRGFVDPAPIEFKSDRLPWVWERTTLAPPNDSPRGTNWIWSPTGRVNQAALARMHFLVWAVCDYRREHKKVPDKLSDLVPTYFAWLPLDAWTGRAFLYEPKGVPARLRATSFGELEAKKPFVASAGAEDCRIVVDRLRRPPVRVLTRSGQDVYRQQPWEERDPVSYPASVVPIPDVATPKSDKAPLLPDFKREGPPANKPPAPPVDKLLTKPAEKSPAPKIPSKK